MVRVTIAVDAMGGDFAPGEIVRGACEAAEARQGVDILLVGREENIKRYLPKEAKPDNLKLIGADEIVGMEEEPAKAVRSKKNSSLMVGCRLVKEGVADGFVSAGNTGAIMAAALFVIGRAEGIDRPAIGAVIPAHDRQMLLLDAGANADVKPENLVQFAKMGVAFVSRVLDVENPKVGLISIGEEPGKGNALVKAAFTLLDGSGLNFAGNIEGRDVPYGRVDVAVCDGFVGNVILKTLEGTSEEVLDRFRDVVKESVQSRLGSLLLLPAIRRFRRDIDPEEHGGALLLGVDGVCIIAHGRSSARAIKNAIFRAIRSVESKIVEGIVKSLKGEDKAV
ncbi:MAG: phosphate acyltransferase PlsX [Actinobacteria bacterium]|nr:phosphate acyltransferase PlsX [Actinomycetota bacterium]